MIPLNDLQYQVGVAQFDQRLALLDHVAGLDEHPIDPPSIDGVNVDGFAGYGVYAQWSQIMKNAALYRSDSHLFKRDAECPHTRPTAKLHGQQDHGHNQHGCGTDLGSERPTPRRPPAVLDLPIHPVERVRSKLELRRSHPQHALWLTVVFA